MPFFHSDPLQCLPRNRSAGTPKCTRPRSPRAEPTLPFNRTNLVLFSPNRTFFVLFPPDRTFFALSGSTRRPSNPSNGLPLPRTEPPLPLNRTNFVLFPPNRTFFALSGSPGATVRPFSRLLVLAPNLRSRSTAQILCSFHRSAHFLCCRGAPGQPSDLSAAFTSSHRTSAPAQPHKFCALSAEPHIFCAVGGAPGKRDPVHRPPSSSHRTLALAQPHKSCALFAKSHIFCAVGEPRGNRQTVQPPSRPCTEPPLPLNRTNLVLSPPNRTLFALSGSPGATAPPFSRRLVLAPNPRSRSTAQILCSFRRTAHFLCCRWSPRRPSNPSSGLPRPRTEPPLPLNRINLVLFPPHRTFFVLTAAAKRD